MKYYCIFVLLLNFSCTKSELVIPKTNCFIKVGYTAPRGDIIHEIQYDKNNRPTLIIGDGTTPIPTMSISYKNGKIIKIVRNKNYSNLICNISHLGNETVQTESYYETNPDVKFFYKYYFKNNLLLKSVSTRSSNPNFNDEQLFTYDNNENLIKSENFDNGILTRTIEYKDYDNKVNPFFSNSVDWTLLNAIITIRIGYTYAIPISKNNPTTFKTHIWLTNYENTENLIIRYNENNLPIGIKTAYSKDDEVSIDYKN